MKFILYTALALVMLASCKDKDEVVQPVVGRDINTAEKVAVDRFSDIAGTLFKRSAASTLPAANAPINLDMAPFITKGYGPMGTLTEYYNFDVHSTTPDDIYVFFKAGASTPITGQHNVIPTIPGDAGYNDFWVVNKVTVPDNYVVNTLTSEAEIIASGYPIAKTTTIVNCPVVPFGSTASKKFGGGSSALTIGWYKNKAVAYFSFEEKALSATNTGMVPVSPIYVMFNNNATGPSSGFKTEANSDQTHNVLATLPSATGYSPLWSVQVVDNAAFANVNNLATASAATILGVNAALVNCPVTK